METGRMQRPLRLTDKNFRKEVLESDIPVLVEFWASWCPPCKMMEPILEELAGELDGRIKVAKINVDQNPKTALRLGIEGVPMFMVFINEKEIIRHAGALSPDQMRDMLETAGLDYPKNRKRPTTRSPVYGG